MTSTEIMKLNACARGDITLAEARDVSPQALAAGRALAAFVARAGRVTSAIRILSGLVALEPTDDWSWRELARRHLERGDAQAAAHAADRAAAVARQRGRTDFAAALLAGRALTALGDGGAARRWLAVAGTADAPPEVARIARALLRRTTP